jgi:hypothetical protein
MSPLPRIMHRKTRGQRIAEERLKYEGRQKTQKKRGTPPPHRAPVKNGALPKKATERLTQPALGQEKLLMRVRGLFVQVPPRVVRFEFHDDKCNSHNGKRY